MSYKPDYLNHRSRLREKFNRGGLKGLADYEQVELLLTYAVSRKDLKPVGKRLISKFKNVSTILDSPIQKLVEIDGIGVHSATLIRLVRELMTKYMEEKMVGSIFEMSSPDSVVNYCRLKIGPNRNELFMVIFLNTKNVVTGFEVIAEGSIDSVAVYPRKVVEKALERQASAIVLVHNHPSGDVKPSEFDIKITDDVRKSALLLGIRVLDHLIVSKDNHFSFLQHQLLKRNIKI